MCISDTVYRNDIQVKKKTEKKNLDERFRWISLLSFKEIYKKKKFNMFEKFFFVTRVNS